MDVTDSVSVVCGGFNLAYKRWTPRDGAVPWKRVMCYPGWLDNAGSFDNLAAVLVREGWDVACPDPPGCGRSQHLPPYAQYADYDEIPMILGLADNLGWTTGPKIVVCGHSRGGGVSTGFACAFPHIVKYLFVVENGLCAMNGAYPTMYNKSPGNCIRKSVYWDKRNSEREPRIFDKFDDIVKASVSNPMFPKTEESARNITRRHVVELPDGRWQYSHDVRTYGQQQRLYCSPHHLNQVAEEIECPVTLIIADYIPFRLTPDVKKNLEHRMTLHKDLTIQRVKGAHHVHTDDAEETFRAMKAGLDQAEGCQDMCHEAKL